MIKLKSMGRPAIAVALASTYLLACAHQALKPKDAGEVSGLASLASLSVDDVRGGPEDPHAEMLRLDPFPSARLCAACHQNIYEEWRSSAHAYSGISPMFHKFEQKLNDLASGTVGAFCVRCHLPVGTEAGQPREMTLYDRSQDTERFVDPYVSVEGVTCIACHRVKERYGRVNGQRRIERGDAFEPMFGSRGGETLERVKSMDSVAADRAEYEAGAEKAPIHGSIHAMPALKESEFCMSCHQVAVHPGIKLEVVWDQYLDSPAHGDDVSCQDCHMGQEPGVWNEVNNFSIAPRAVVNNIEEIFHSEDVQQVVDEETGAVTEVKGILHKDHSFVGPGYSIAHPGIFPHNAKPMTRLDGTSITIEEWMLFPWREAWGNLDFEEELLRNPDAAQIPSAWSETESPWLHPEVRKAGRLFVEKNLEELAKRKIRREQVMNNASKIEGPFFDLGASKTPRVGKGLDFKYEVTNICEGHNLPSGSLGAQPQVWLNVSLLDPDGNRVWESGYVDDAGDLADLHSAQVLSGDPNVPHDDQLFNLQSKFLTTNVKGTDREMFLPVNIDIDQVPFIRPAGVPSTVINHPPFIRMEQHSIPPLRTRDADYSIPGSAFKKPGTYQLAVRLRSRAEPIYFMNFVGSTEEMKQRMNERMADAHFYSVSFEVR